jgi:serine phosphatase RsbU (regulator of sigma subunit)
MHADQTLGLQQQIVRLQALLEASRRIHSTIQLDEVLRCALEIVVRELEMEGAFFAGFPFSEGRIPPRFLVANSSELKRGCNRFPIIDKSGIQITELLVIPRDGSQLTLEETDFLESLAIQIAVAIENARHHERAIHLQRVEQDLAAARAIQRSLLPHSIQQIPGYGLATRCLSCYEVGGDYLDVVALPSGEQMMIIADVAGKGLASALVGSSFRAAFRAMAVAGIPLVQIAKQLTALHFEEGAEARQRYVTALFLHLDPQSNSLQVVNAGHNPGLLFSGSRKHPVLLQASGTPIGMLPVAEYESERHELKPGSRLLAYTDGLTEIFRGEDEFGIERLAETFYVCRAPDAHAVLDHIWRTLEAFGTEPEQRDDMTALVLIRNDETR